MLSSHPDVAVDPINLAVAGPQVVPLAVEAPNDVDEVAGSWHHYIADPGSLGRHIRGGRPGPSVADMAIHRLLCIRAGRTHVGKPEVPWAFGMSLMVSATRCLLSYIVRVRLCWSDGGVPVIRGLM